MLATKIFELIGEAASAEEGGDIGVIGGRGIIAGPAGGVVSMSVTVDDSSPGDDSGGGALSCGSSAGVSDMAVAVGVAFLVGCSRTINTRR